MTGVTISMMSRHWCLRMEKEWKNGGVSGVEESTECRRDWTCLLHQFIAIVWAFDVYLFISAPYFTGTSHGARNRRRHILRSLIHSIPQVQSCCHFMSVARFHPPMWDSYWSSSGLGSSCMADIVITSTMVLYLVRLPFYRFVLDGDHWSTR